RRCDREAFRWQPHGLLQGERDPQHAPMEFRQATELLRHRSQAITERREGQLTLGLRRPRLQDKKAAFLRALDACAPERRLTDSSGAFKNEGDWIFARPLQK